MKKPKIHPSAPRKLVSAFRRAKYHFHPLARERGVNISYVYALLTKGKEPNNPEIRAKLFLPRRKRPSRPAAPIPGPPDPPALSWWKHLTPAQRMGRLYFLYNLEGHNKGKDKSK